MSFAVANDLERPEFTTVSEIRINRIAQNPHVEVDYVETVRVLEGTVEVATADSRDGDNLYERLCVPDWTGRTNMVGKTIFRPDGSKVGKIVTFVPESAVLTLDAGLIDNPSHSLVTLHAVNNLGEVMFRQANGGRRWTNVLHAGSPEAVLLIFKFMGRIMWNALDKAFTEMGETKPTEETLALVQALAAKGITIDSLFTEAAEALEIDRRSNLAQGVVAQGSAPAITG
jgi:hypothetical protein